MISTRYIYTILHILILILSLVTQWYQQLSISLALLLLVMVIDKMGKGIVLRESTAVLYVITCLVLPVIGYNFYTAENYLAKLWGKYMPVPQNVYFAYVLPAITCFSMAITWPLGFKGSADEGEILNDSFRKIREVLLQNRKFGIWLVIVGCLSGRIVNLLPGSLQFFATLVFFSSFTGLLYIYFLPNYKYKNLVLGGFILFILSSALDSGMFTIVVYMSVTMFSFFLINKRPSILKKVIILVLTVGFVLVLQNTKLAYRKYIWRSNYTDNRAQLFVKLFFDNLRQGDILVENTAFFTTYARLNQGFNVSLVMRRIPKNQDFDGGKMLFTNMSSAVVPRFLWPDKPEAGGKANMRYYAGYAIRRFSTNVGPVGEAYGSFGVWGGVVFMLLLGFFIRWAYKFVFKLSKKLPLLIFWIPVLFYQVTYSCETDTLQILNSLIKAAFFIWLLHKIFSGKFILQKISNKGSTAVSPVATP